MTTTRRWASCCFHFCCELLLVVQLHGFVCLPSPAWRAAGPTSIPGQAPCAAAPRRAVCQAHILTLTEHFFCWLQVRELWYRASLAWQEVLSSGGSSGGGKRRQAQQGRPEGATLVVAHNAGECCARFACHCSPATLCPPQAEARRRRRHPRANPIPPLPGCPQSTRRCCAPRWACRPPSSAASPRATPPSPCSTLRGRAARAARAAAAAAARRRRE